ncbi:hypothetical protein EsH8_II_001373 [Colletotrichum jinshuiense]
MSICSVILTKFFSKYDFLLHALLGLGAANLSLATEESFLRQALDHRVRAIRALNGKLSSAGPGGFLTGPDGDAAFAAIMALTFQAGHMPEGMFDFISMVRGCHIVATKAMPSFETSAFRSFSRQEHADGFKMLVVRSISQAPPDDKTVLLGVFNAFLQSLGNIAPLCRSILEVEYLAGMKRVVALFLAGSEEGKFPLNPNSPRQKENMKITLTHDDEITIVDE